jgi:hypothetical protein
VIAGGLGAGFIEDHLGEPWMIGILLIVFGALLWDADGRPQQRSLQDMRLRDGLYVGLAQVIALAPGTSRSGIDHRRRYLGLDRDSHGSLSSSDPSGRGGDRVQRLRGDQGRPSG